jgi:hypothetical protein
VIILLCSILCLGFDAFWNESWRDRIRTTAYGEAVQQNEQNQRKEK